MTTQTFTVTASNEFGDTSAEVSIEITTLKPQIVIPVPELEWTEGQKFVPVDFGSFFDGAGMKFSAENLPEGFELTEEGMLIRP